MQHMQMSTLQLKHFVPWDMNHLLAQYWMMPTYFPWQAQKYSRSVEEPNGNLEFGVEYEIEEE